MLVEKSAHTCTERLSSDLPQPLQSVCQSPGELDTVTDKVQYVADSHSYTLNECMHSKHCSN